MRVLITGATGFTGSRVVPLLLRHHEVRCFIRKSSVTDSLPLNQIELSFGDLGDRQSLREALRGMDALVNVASLGFGHAPDIVGAAEEAGVSRAIFVSTTAVNTTLNASSKTVRLAAEDTIRQSSLRYTILRPTMIYGSPRDRNISRLIQYLSRWPIIPVFGTGEQLQQPVHVDDVAWAIVNSLDSEKAVAQTYNVSGEAPVTYNELISIVCSLLGRRVRRVHVPAGPVTACLGMLERFRLPLPIKSEQIRRLNEDKAFSYDAAARDFGYRPRSVRDGLREEVKQMGFS